jgi:hypothetical protein
MKSDVMFPIVAIICIKCISNKRMQIFQFDESSKVLFVMSNKLMMWDVNWW